MLARSCCGESPVRPDLDIGRASGGELGADAGDRRLEVLPDVVRKRLQRRHVDDERLVGKGLARALAHQRIDGGQERRERLPRARGRRDQDIAPRLDRRPGARLRRGRRREMGVEPRGNGRVEAGCLLHRS
jgi:hypothetical protein